MRVAWSAAERFLAICLLLFGQLVLAQIAFAAGEAGFVTTLSGTVSAHGADGRLRTLGKDAPLFAGDTVMTEKGSAVRLRFTDGTSVTLRPNSRLAIEKYRFAENAPQEDAAVLNLVKGGLRTVTGLVGKRGNKDAHLTRTPAANIGIRGTDYALLLCDAGDALCAEELKAQAMASPQGPALGRFEGVVPPGLYVAVFEGVIVIFNRSGEKTLAAVRAAHVPDFDSLPVELPEDPGLARLFPPLGRIPGVDDPLGLDGSQDACLVR